MTPEKAGDILMRKTTIPGDGISFSEIEEAIDMALDALKKQTPMAHVLKPMRVDDKGNVLYARFCPACDGEIVEEDYCPHCGQKMEWG